jgi:hypothetical protein
MSNDERPATFRHSGFVIGHQATGFSLVPGRVIRTSAFVIQIKGNEQFDFRWQHAGPYHQA